MKKEKNPDDDDSRRRRTTFLETLFPMLILFFQVALSLVHLGIILFQWVWSLAVLVPWQAAQSARESYLEFLDEYGLDHFGLLRGPHIITNSSSSSSSSSNNNNQDAASYIDRKDFSDHVRYERIEYGNGLLEEH